MKQSRKKVSQGLLSTLLLLAMAVVLCAITGAGIWFALPREPVMSAGYMHDYSWSQPVYVPSPTGVGIYADFTDDELIALDATSTTSGCRIFWQPRENKYIDPCCGAQWARDGVPVQVAWQARRQLPSPLIHYRIEVTTDGEILIHPWRVKGVNDSGSC